MVTIKSLTEDLKYQKEYFWIYRQNKHKYNLEKGRQEKKRQKLLMEKYIKDNQLSNI